MGQIQGLTRMWEKICSRVPLLTHAYSNRYRKVVQREIDLGGITHRDRVLNIGCGAIPFTALLLARMTGAGVTAVDRDPEAVGRARKCVKRMQLSEAISVEVADGRRISAEPFSVTVVALQAEPKEEILENLLSTGREGLRAIFRSPSAAFDSNYDCLPVQCTPAGEIDQHKLTFDRSVLYVKRNSGG